MDRGPGRAGRGPPGQTHPDNLAPLRTLAHRAKTHGRWRIRNAGDGVYLWRSGYGHYYQVDATGTHRLTRQAGQAWWDTLTRTDAAEHTIHLTAAHPASATPTPDTARPAEPTDTGASDGAA